MKDMAGLHAVRSQNKTGGKNAGMWKKYFCTEDQRMTASTKEENLQVELD